MATGTVSFSRWALEVRALLPAMLLTIVSSFELLIRFLPTCQCQLAHFPKPSCLLKPCRSPSISGLHLQAKNPYTCPLHRWINCYAFADGNAVSTSLATIIVSIASILKQNITTRTALRGHLIHFLRIMSEFIMMALWIASFITMLLPKGKDFRVLFDKPPHIVWGVAIAIAILEASVSLYSHLMRGRARS